MWSYQTDSQSYLSSAEQVSQQKAAQTRLEAFIKVFVLSAICPKGLREARVML